MGAPMGISPAQNLPRLPRVMLTLASFATIAPVFGGYFCSFWLLCWLVARGPWRPSARRAQSEALGHADGLAAALRPLSLGVLVMVGAQVLANFGSAFTSPYAEPLRRVFSTQIHMVLKLGLVWFVIAAANGAARRRRWFVVRDAAPWFFAWLLAHFVYCFVQRETGIDWVHGFSAQLGGDRFAYGVYRVNGISGHPLSLAYNLTLLSLTAAWLLTKRRVWLAEAFGAVTVKWWTGIFAVTFLTLAISGSRFPLVAVGILFAATNLRLLWAKKWSFLGLLIVLAAGLWFEHGTLARTFELFDQNVPLLERFPRLVYWRVNAQMFFDQPLFGVGQAGLTRAYETYYAANSVSDKLYIAHNIFLQAAADSGAVGLIGLGALLAGVFASARRLDRAGGTGSGLRLLGLAGIVCGLFQNNFRDSEFLFAFWFLTAVIAAVSLDAVYPADTVETGLRGRKSPKNLQSPAGHADPQPDLPG